ncbi:MAG TPA: DUF423 domain-containing protein [Steroidobacteraceae bacterium]|nr:DUF423 domain-containing protein [Steroidobacteraceae bacterium]
MLVDSRVLDGRRTLAAAGLLLAAATVLGALGAHALKSQLSPERLATYDTAVRYHFLHALGLLVVGALLRTVDTPLLRWASGLLVAGILLFSGSLYLLSFGLSLGVPRIIGMATPLGGLALITGWILFAVAMLRP